MNLALQLLAVAVGTVLVVLATTRIVQRFAPNSIHAHIVASGLRGGITVLVCIALAASGIEHRTTLVFAVGAAYFATVVIDGLFTWKKLTAPSAAPGDDSRKL